MKTFAPTKRSAPPNLLNAHDLRTPRLPGGAPPLIFSGDGKEAPLRNHYKGQSLFLVLSGPSTRELDLTVLKGRGLVSMAVNNAWTLLRPNFWVGVDPPSRFVDLGWLDPGITKFVPACHIHSPIREFDGRVIGPSPLRVKDCPATWFFNRRDTFDPDTFWTEQGLEWGSTTTGTDALGLKNSRSVMLPALRLAHYLGFSTLYLLGCDFHMEGDKPYAFSERKSARGVSANNALYKALTQRFESLVRKGLPLSVVNCNPASALRTFPFLPFREAIEIESARFQRRTPANGWY